MQEDGIISRHSNGYDLEECRLAYIRYLRKNSKFTKSESAGDINAEKASLTKAQADEREIQVAKLIGELIPAEVVESTWADYVANTRAKLLAIPNKTAQQILALETYQQVESFLKDMIYEALEELADGAEYDGDSAEQGEQDLETTTSTKNLPVVR